jgi:hypothetical protein
MSNFNWQQYRMIGQESLREKDSPIRNDVQRRRIRTVIQNIIYMAVRLVRHAGGVRNTFDSYFQNPLSSSLE